MTPFQPDVGPSSLSLPVVDRLLDAIRGKRVLVAGDLMMDRYLAGVVDRISPEAPVPVLRVEEEWVRVGGAGNVAANIRSLGGECELLAVVGRDADGDELIRQMEGDGIGVSGVVRDPARPTTVKTRLISRGQQVARFDRESVAPVTGEVHEALAASARASLDRVEALALEDYDKGVLSSALRAILLEGARERGMPVVVDPKRLGFFGFHGVTVFKPNVRELSEALGEPLRLEDSDWVQGVRERLGADTLLLTRGEEGMLLADRERGVTRFPASARAVFDVSGAGDTVTAVMALALAGGVSLDEAALLANDAAGIGVGKAGVATILPEELREWARTRDLVRSRERESRSQST